MDEKKSSTARLPGGKCARLQSVDESLDFFEGFRDKLVVNPPPVLAVANDSRVFEDAKMERQTRLRSVEGVGQLADATLSFAEQLDDLESRLVGEGVKKLDRALGAGISCYSHETNISRKVVTSRVSEVLSRRGK